jgi:hypothetical protein
MQGRQPKHKSHKAFPPSAVPADVFQKKPGPRASQGDDLIPSAREEALTTTLLAAAMQLQIRHQQPTESTGALFAEVSDFAGTSGGIACRNAAQSFSGVGVEVVPIFVPTTISYGVLLTLWPDRVND